MMMASAENLSLYSALLGEDLSVWSSDDHAKQFGDGAPLDISLGDTLVSSPGSESSDSLGGDQSDPLPEWMSEKIAVMDWLDDFDKSIISHELPINKNVLLTADSFIGAPAILDFVGVKGPGIGEMLSPLSPIGSIDSSGTAVNSSVSSPGPYSPVETDSIGPDSTGFDSQFDALSPISSINITETGVNSSLGPYYTAGSDSTGFNPGFDATLPLKIEGESPVDSIGPDATGFDSQFDALSPISSINITETVVNSSLGPYSPAGSDSTGFDPGFDATLPLKIEGQSPVDVQALINSCQDTDTFLRLAALGSVDLALPSSGEDVIAPLPEEPPSKQTDLRSKIKTGEDAYTLEVKSPNSGKAGRPKRVTKERRERKKGQNKEAATRYRTKKKRESQDLVSQLSGLEKSNGALKDQVGSLEKEISYLKELLQEIYKVKGQIKILKSP